WPNNATLVIVGDIEPKNAFALAKKYFEKIPGNLQYKKDQFYFNNDIIAREIRLYRDVAQPFGIVGFVIPGAESKNEHLIDVLTILLGMGKGSRLYRKIVDELRLATSLLSSPILLFEHGIFFILFEPKDAPTIPAIQQAINDEIEDIIENGLSDLEITRA